MSKHKGFTFVEVSLFLVVTALLFIGIASAMNVTIFRQKYEDSVNNFAEFLRSIYSQVSNTQSPGAGNSNTAIYGKLVVFGETTDMLGNPIDTTNDGQQIFTYDVIGRADSTYGIGSGQVLPLLQSLGANVVFVDRDSANINKITNVRLATPERYAPRWSAEIQNRDGTPMAKSILVVRHPRSGTVNTLVYDGTIQVNAEVASQRQSCIDGSESCKIDNLLTQYFDRFYIDEVDFCVASDELGRSAFSSRQDIRILSNARNAASVQKIDMDGGDNQCK
ncbi:hypothetical protein IJ076_02685 [Candidatus Saccharibacteria bacterium]|nr:hypothetical protein [Candidatus Saccharibacteria bacterium]